VLLCVEKNGGRRRCEGRKAAMATRGRDFFQQKKKFFKKIKRLEIENLF
jgi:hypothetical protein